MLGACPAVGEQSRGWAMLQRRVRGGCWGPPHRGQLHVGMSSLWEETLTGLGEGCRAGDVPVQVAPVLRVESQEPCGLQTPQYRFVQGAGG